MCNIQLDIIYGAQNDRRSVQVIYFKRVILTQETAEERLKLFLKKF